MTARSITLMLFVTSAFRIACEGSRATEIVQPRVDSPSDPDARHSQPKKTTSGVRQ